MNNLVEKALHGLDVARRRSTEYLVLLLGIGGFLAASVTVFAGGRIGAAPAAIPLNSWLGLLPHAGYEVTDLIPGLVMLTAIAVLCALWLLALVAVRARRVDERDVWKIASGWALAFIVGPPLLSTDVFGYVAHGLLARDDLSPYHHAPSSLDEPRLINAIDPTARGEPSTDGPLSSAIQHLFVLVSAGNPLSTVILLRALAVASTLAIGRLAADLARRRASAVALTALNPATLLFIVSAAHLDGPFIALLLASLRAAGRRRWTPAVVLVCLAAGLQPVGLIAVAAVVTAHSAGVRGRSSSERTWHVLARDLTVAVATLAACSLVVPFGLGWAGNLGTVARNHTPFAPASLLSDLVSVIVPSAAFDDLALGGRIATVLAGTTAVGYLLVTVRARPLERSVGFALLAAGLCGPVVYPWYLLWGLLVLAPTARRTQRDWVLGLSVAACLLAPAGFATRTAETVAAGALAVVAAVLLPRLYARHRRTSRLAARPAGDLAHGGTDVGEVHAGDHGGDE